MGRSHSQGMTGVHGWADRPNLRAPVYVAGSTWRAALSGNGVALMSDVPPEPIGRRTFLAGAAATGVALAVGASGTRLAHAAVVRTDPFALGVASGDPRPGAVMLWTRLVRHPLDARSMPRRPVEVEWELSGHHRFRGSRRTGSAWALPELAHSVHVDVHGLEPATDYWYRFRVGRHVSEPGHTRTAPRSTATVDNLRVGVVSCQDWQSGYWPAFSALAEEDLDVVLHLGDYIYESDPASVYRDRRHNTSQTRGLNQLVTLSDYRNRHALYKTDPALQAAHAAFPWVLTWDDHDVESNYAGVVDSDARGRRWQSPARFARQRARAYQAYYEHMPIRVPYKVGSSHLRIYRRLDFGDLMRLHVLDTRQYRTDQPGGTSGDHGPEDIGRANAGGTLTGAAQGSWLRAGLRSSSARWDVIAQQVMMSRLRFGILPGPSQFQSNLDQWDGYAPDRDRFLRFLDSSGIASAVVLAGDMHASWFSDLKLDFDDPASRVVASEYVGTSISSGFAPEDDAALKQANPVLNPHVRFFDGARRGYLRLDLDQQRLLVEQRSVDTITSRTAPVRTTAAFATEAGVPGVVPA
jgi:alkaline phosphatase D